VIPWDRLDFSGVAAEDDPMTPVTPGEILRMDFMEPFGLSANALAKALRVPPNRITAILDGNRAPPIPPCGWLATSIPAPRPG
jgi:hypothetical protein